MYLNGIAQLIINLIHFFFLDDKEMQKLYRIKGWIFIFNFFFVFFLIAGNSRSSWGSLKFPENLFILSATNVDYAFVLCNKTIAGENFRFFPVIFWFRRMKKYNIFSERARYFINNKYAKCKPLMNRYRSHILEGKSLLF